MIDENTIDRILEMSRLEIKEDQKVRFYSQMKDIIGYIENISKIDTSGADDRESVFDVKNVMTEDSIEQGLTSAQLRKYTKNFLDGYYAVPKILQR